METCEREFHGNAPGMCVRCADQVGQEEQAVVGRVKGRKVGESGIEWGEGRLPQTALPKAWFGEGLHLCVSGKTCFGRWTRWFVGWSGLP